VEEKRNYDFLFDMKDEIKKIIKYFSELNYDFSNVEIKEKDSKNFIAIDGGNNAFKDDLLNFFGCNYIRVVAYSENKVLEKKEFILFEKVPYDLKREQIKKLNLSIFGDEDLILKKLGEKDYHFEKIEENSFTLKIRNLLELSFLAKYSKDYLVARDGSFFLPDLIGLKKEINRAINKNNVFALAKSSKILRNKMFLINIDNNSVFKVDKNLLKDFYEAENLLDFETFLYSHFKSFYQLETLEENLDIVLSSIKEQIKKGKHGYPRNLIMADKIAKASDIKVKSLERKLLSMIYQEKEVFEILEAIKEKIFQIRKY